MIAGITATAEFFCNVTGATGEVTYSWLQTQNGVFPELLFPGLIFEERVHGHDRVTLRIWNLSGLEQNFDYTCVVYINGREIGSATGTLTSPGS